MSVEGKKRRERREDAPQVASRPLLGPPRSIRPRIAEVLVAGDLFRRKERGQRGEGQFVGEEGKKGNGKTHDLVTDVARQCPTTCAGDLVATSLFRRNAVTVVEVGGTGKEELSVPCRRFQ